MPFLPCHSWISPLINLGNKHALEQSDLPAIGKRDEAAGLCRDLERYRRLVIPYMIRCVFSHPEQIVREHLFFLYFHVVLEKYGVHVPICILWKDFVPNKVCVYILGALLFNTIEN